MAKLKAHWTQSGIASFVYRISFDFIAQLQKKVQNEDVKMYELAQKLGVDKSRVSQVFNDPGNLTLKNIVRYAGALGLKVAIVAYDDNDPENKNGPISSEVFSNCWEKAGKPEDFFDLTTAEIRADRIFLLATYGAKMLNAGNETHEKLEGAIVEKTAETGQLIATVN